VLKIVSNYKSISLTCVASKVTDKIAMDEIFAYFEKLNIISRTQHGFLKVLSTCINLKSMNDWTSSLQNKCYVIITDVDFVKAFDSVSHEKLLYRLQTYIVLMAISYFG